MRTVITGGTLIDGTGRPPVEGMVVAIEENRIRAVGRKEDFGSSLSEDQGNVIDASGKWVLPGLINAHDHLVFREIPGLLREEVWRRGPVEVALEAVRNAATALKRGWTTIREMGATQGIDLQIRDLIDRGKIPGPRIITVCTPICVTGQGRGLHLEADGPDAIRRAAREQLKAGADMVKVFASFDPCPMPGPEQTRPEMSPEEIQAAFEEARRWGKRTTAHVMGSEAIANVLDAGIDVADHGFYLNEPLAERMARQGTYLCPTLSSYCRQTMNPRFRRGEKWAKAHMVLVEPALESFRAAVQAGVKVVVGTDSVGSYAEEIEMMREGGMTPMATLLACTRTAAEALGRQDSLGTLEEGKLADVALLSGDPILDPRAVEQIHLVVKDGVTYRSEEITL